MYNEIDLDKIDVTLEPPTEEPARQYYFMAKCREWVRVFEQKRMLSDRFHSDFWLSNECKGQ